MLEPPPALGRTSLLDYAADLEGTVGHLDASPILIGHSMGGMLAQLLAQRRPASALVLLASMPPQGINVLSPPSLRMFRTTLLSWGFWRKPTRPTFADATASMLGHLEPEERRAVYDRLVYEFGRVGCETGFWSVDPQRAKWVDTARIACPVLVVAGAEDRLHPPAAMRWVARKYEPRSTYLEFAGHGHWLVGEPRWQEVASGISDWLDLHLVKRPPS
jgi:pimeloyl-ACP methyl ester carboxylesterase